MKLVVAMVLLPDYPVLCRRKAQAPLLLSTLQALVRVGIVVLLVLTRTRLLAQLVTILKEALLAVTRGLRDRILALSTTPRALFVVALVVSEVLAEVVAEVVAESELL